MKNKNFQTIRQAEALAKKKIRTGTFEWLQAGVEDNYTRDKNILDLQKLKIIPRHLSGIKKKNITCKIFGKKN